MKNLSIKQKLFSSELIVFFLLFSIIIATVITNNIVTRNSGLVIHELSHINAIKELQLAFDKVLMPANDYLIHGDVVEKDLSARLVEDLRNKFKSFSHITGDNRLITDINAINSDVQILGKDLEKAVALINKIFELKDPVGNREGSRIMEEMDSLVDGIIVNFDRFADARMAILYNARKNADSVRNLAQSVIIILGLVSIISLILLGRWLIKSITAPIDCLVAATQKIAGGNLDNKVQVYSQDEFKVLADSFNEMTNDLRNVQHRLLRTEKLASLGQLSAGVAHEINNPTGFVISNLDILKGHAKQLMDASFAFEKLLMQVFAQNEDISNMYSPHVETIRNEKNLDYIRADIHNLIDETLAGAFRIRKIVANMRNFTHPDDEVKQLVDINTEVDLAIAIAENEIKYKCKIEKKFQDIPLILCNPGQLNQVFVIMLMNASQAIDQAGHIVIETYVEDNCACVKFTDNGRGISPEHLDKIFEPFFTTKDVGEGTGLGLSIAYGIIRKRGGIIEAESSPGQGTIFIIRIPLEEKDVENG